MVTKSLLSVALSSCLCFTACTEQSPVAPEGPAQTQAGPAESAADRTSPVTRVSDGSVVEGAYSRLVRLASGVSITLHTSDLDVESAYSLWVVIFNNPAGCSEPCGNDDLTNAAAEPSARFGVGHLIGQSGKGSFGAHIPAGNTGEGLPAAPPPPFGPGLLNPLGAEIHLVLRTHGPAAPASLPEQIASFNGGCPPNTCENRQVSVHKP